MCPNAALVKKENHKLSILWDLLNLTIYKHWEYKPYKKVKLICLTKTVHAAKFLTASSFPTLNCKCATSEYTANYAQLKKKCNKFKEHTFP